MVAKSGSLRAVSFEPIKLIRPADATSLNVENITGAIQRMAELDEFKDDEFVFSAHGEVNGDHNSERFRASQASLNLIANVLRSVGELASVTLSARRTVDGSDGSVAHISIDFRNRLATATVTKASGLTLEAARDLAFRLVEPFPYMDTHGGVRDVEAERLRVEMGRLLDETRRELAEVRTANTEAQELIKNQRETVQESTIKHHAKVFSDEAKKHAWIALLWLVLSSLAVAGLFWVAFTFESIDLADIAASEEADGSEAATPSGLSDLVLTIHILERVTLLSILATVLGVSVRQHRASLHNWVVATHRSNALNSYEAFAGATKDKPGADQLLAQALALTFTPKDTGYSKPSGAPDGAHLFTEIGKAFTSSGKS